MAGQRRIGRAAACVPAPNFAPSGSRVYARSGRSVIYTPFVGQVSNRCGIANLPSDGATYMSTTFHRMLSVGGVTGIGIDTVNWYVPSNPGAAETNGASGATIKGAVEYPAGTFTAFKWSGSSAAATVAPGATLASDLLAINIPYGADFKIHRQLVNLPSYNDVNGQRRSVSFGDAVEPTTTDKTMTGGVIDGGSNHSFFPAAIWGQTSTKSFASAGNSIAAGEGDTVVDATGQQGIFARALGMTLPNLTVAIASDGIIAFNASGAKRTALAKRATCILSDYGINNRAQSTASVEAGLTTFATNFGSWPVFQSTLTPVSTGAWTATDGSDQTVDGNNAFRVTINGDLRAGNISGLAGYIEISDFVELVRDGGKWKADGTPGKYTADGLHPSTFTGSVIVISSSIIPGGPFPYMPTS